MNKDTEAISAFFPDVRGLIYKATFMTDLTRAVNEDDPSKVDPMVRKLLTGTDVGTQLDTKIGDHIVKFIILTAIYHRHLTREAMNGPNANKLYKAVIENWSSLSPDTKHFFNFMFQVNDGNKLMDIEEFVKIQTHDLRNYWFVFRLVNMGVGQLAQYHGWPSFSVSIPKVAQKMTEIVMHDGTIRPINRIVPQSQPLKPYDLESSRLILAHIYSYVVNSHNQFNNLYIGPINIPYTGITEFEVAKKYYNGSAWLPTPVMDGIIADRLAEIDREPENNIQLIMKELDGQILTEVLGGSEWKVYNGYLFQVVDGQYVHEGRDSNDPRNYKYMYDRRGACYSTNLPDGKCNKWLLQCILSNDDDSISHCLDSITHNSGVFDNLDLRAVVDTHPDLVLATLKKFGFKLVASSQDGREFWRVESIPEWIDAGHFKKVWPDDPPTSGPSVEDVNAKIPKKGIEKLTDAVKANRKFFAYLGTLINITNSKNYQALNGYNSVSSNSGAFIPYEVTVPKWAQHMTPLVLSDRRRLAGITGLADIVRLRSNYRNALLPHINLNVGREQQIYSPAGIPLIKWGMSPLTDTIGSPILLGGSGFKLVPKATTKQLGGSYQQLGGVLPVAYKVVPEDIGDKFKQMYVTAKRRVTNAGGVIANENDFIKKLDQYKMLHKDITKTLHALNDFVDMVNKYGFRKESRYLNINSITKISNHYNNILRKYVKSEDRMLEMIETIYDSMVKDNAKDITVINN